MPELLACVPHQKEERAEALIGAYTILVERLLLQGYRVRFGNLGYFQLIPHEMDTNSSIKFIISPVKVSAIHNELKACDDPYVWYRFRMSYANRKYTNASKQKSKQTHIQRKKSKRKKT